MEVRVLTCAYCGKEYPQGTQAWGDEILTDHIRECSKHPMRKVEADKEMLRNALAGIIGVSSKEELEVMELTVRMLPTPQADKIAMLDGIHALLATLPEERIKKERKDGA